MTSLFSASWKNPGLTFYGLSRAAQPNLAWQQGLSIPILPRRGLRRAEAASNVPWVVVAPVAPSSLTGLIGWWDASVFASLGLSGSNISSIADQSGFGNTMGSVGGISDPTYSATGFNGKPGISTNIASPSSFETSSPFAMGTGNTLTAWWVGTNAGASSQSGARYLSYGDIAIQDNDNVGYWCINAKGTNQNLIDVSRRVSVVTPVDVAISNGNHIVIVTINSSGVITMYLDGVASTLQTEPGNWISAGQVAIGRKAETNSTYIQATFGECGIATGFTSSSNVAGLYLYLKNKWGL